MINNWKTPDSSCVNTACCEHVFSTWYRAFLNNNALMVMSMGSYPKDITRNFLVLSMSTAIFFPFDQSPTNTLKHSGGHSGRTRNTFGSSQPYGQAEREQQGPLASE